MQEQASRFVHSGRTVALVPTMGYLHEGHLSLIREGKKHANVVVLSIFVNPIQFGPGEDLARYPTDLDRDMALAKKEGVDLVFLPQKEVMYGKGHETFVDLEKLPTHLCGNSRPGHFRGVATVVSKLFNIVKPQVALFGEKDYQQLAIIRRMVEDLNFDIRVIGCPIVREPDGLAMSSRNSYLSSEQRKSALCLYGALKKARKTLAQGCRDVKAIINDLVEFINSHKETQIDYIDFCDPDTLERVSRIEGKTLLALAVKVGNTRLIDNALLTP